MLANRNKNKWWCIDFSFLFWLKQHCEHGCWMVLFCLFMRYELQFVHVCSLDRAKKWRAAIKLVWENGMNCGNDLPALCWVRFYCVADAHTHHHAWTVCSVVFARMQKIGQHQCTHPIINRPLPWPWCYFSFFWFQSSVTLKHHCMRFHKSGKESWRIHAKAHVWHWNENNKQNNNNHQPPAISIW